MEMINFWHWLILAAVLMGAEIFVPGAFMIWIGFASALVGLFAWLFPGMGPELQLLLFAVFSVIFAIAGKKFVRSQQKPTDHPNLNQRAARYVGQKVVVSQALSHGKGKVRVGDTEWLASGPDAAEGEMVKVVGSTGTTLLVEKE